MGRSRPTCTWTRPGLGAGILWALLLSACEVGPALDEEDLLLAGEAPPSVAPVAPAAAAELPAALALTSPAFQPSEAIPRDHTCQGADRSPALSWTGLPAGTRSLVLIVDDPDAPDPKAPRMTWVHWVLYNLPADSAGLPEGGALPVGTLEGLNDWKRTGWGGPCPPVGRHRYFFKLYALDAPLPDLNQPSKAQVEQAMTGHVLGQATLMGTYQKS